MPLHGPIERTISNRIVYVSASGSDSNDGLTPSTPKQTIAAGKSLLRTGYPDWMLLKRGDTFSTGLGQWVTSGASATRPQIVGTYGTGSRPILQSGTADGMYFLASGPSPATISYVTVRGLELTAEGYDGTGGVAHDTFPIGVSVLMPVNYLTIEDCYIHDFETGVAVAGYGGDKTNITLKKNVIYRNYRAYSGTSSHGVYFANTAGIVLTDNVIDHNGWNEDVDDADPSEFRHNVYINQTGNSGLVATGNIIARGASHGLQARTGGTVSGNLFLQNSVGLKVGGGDDPVFPGGVSCTVSGNVFLDGKDIDAQNLRGWAMEFSNIDMCVVSDNIISLNSNGTFPLPVSVRGDTSGGVRRITFRDNIVYNWTGTVQFAGNAGQLTTTTWERNHVYNDANDDPLASVEASSAVSGITSINNKWYSTNSSSTWLEIAGVARSLAQWNAALGDSGSVSADVSGYYNPGRSIETYCMELGIGATLEAFLVEARAQSVNNWRSEYTAASVIEYIAEGFGSA